MIILMLDPRYENLCLVFSFVEKEQGVALVEEYDRKSLYTMLVICHERFHPLVKSERNFANHDIFITIIVWIYSRRLQAQMNQ
jgi:hypothetical protein